MRSMDKYRGCLIGGAVGDALGYAVEFCNENYIFNKYGARGITEYVLVNGVARISDDTQMTLYTANGLLIAPVWEKKLGVSAPYSACIRMCYQDWLKTQVYKSADSESPQVSWLNNIPAMNNSRAPGITCLTALAQKRTGSIADPLNNSKGCGGVMRMAPIGLYFGNKGLSLDEIDMLGAEAAALTHGHELGYIPAAMFAHIVCLLAHNSEMTVLQAVADAKAALPRLFPKAIHLPALLFLVDEAIRLAADDSVDDLAAIHALGEGWVAEEALAIAIFCSLRHEHDFERAMIAAVNHRGDSDSTGAIAGNILGARLGMEAIPEKFLTSLELKDTILEIADDLFRDSEASDNGGNPNPLWRQKYIDCTYAGA